MDKVGGGAWVRPSRAIAAAAAIALAGLAAAGCGREPAGATPARRTVQRERYLVGAHYYVWYPSNFRHGFLRGKLSPRQEPQIGLYDSSDPSSAEQHIAWCSQYGIDFVTLDWWPTRPVQNAAVTNGFLRASNLADVRFCIFYETWALAFDRATETTRFDDRAIERFLRDMHGLADRFFSHPSYLRVEGRPVLILYLTRTFTGRYREAIARLRGEMRARGLDPYLIGDEMFWGVSAARDDAQGKPIGTRQLQRERIALFDAVFGYNLYDWSQAAHAGYGARSAFFADVKRISADYRAAAAPAVGFVPDVIPGYNDRGVRLNRKHFVIPRRWDSDDAEGSFFERSLDELALPFVDPDLNMVFVTTFNEWNEDTAIEPLKEAAATARDVSPAGSAFTDGHVFAGHGMRYLEILRDRFVAVAGRVTDAQGAPRPGVRVAATTSGSVAAHDVSDSRGYYTLSRLRLPPGPCDVTAADADPVRVEVLAGRTATNVNFTVR